MKTLIMLKVRYLLQTSVPSHQTGKDGFLTWADGINSRWLLKNPTHNRLLRKHCTNHLHQSTPHMVVYFHTSSNNNNKKKGKQEMARVSFVFFYFQENRATRLVSVPMPNAHLERLGQIRLHSRAHPILELFCNRQSKKVSEK